MRKLFFILLVILRATAAVCYAQQITQSRTELLTDSVNELITHGIQVNSPRSYDGGVIFTEERTYKISIKNSASDTLKNPILEKVKRIGQYPEAITDSTNFLIQSNADSLLRFPNNHIENVKQGLKNVANPIDENISNTRDVIEQKANGISSKLSHAISTSTDGTVCHTTFLVSMFKFPKKLHPHLLLN